MADWRVSRWVAIDRRLVGGWAADEGNPSARGIPTGVKLRILSQRSAEHRQTTFEATCFATSLPLRPRVATSSHRETQSLGGAARSAMPLARAVSAEIPFCLQHLRSQN